MKKEHKWIDIDNNIECNIAESMFESYVEVCKNLNIEPTYKYSDIEDIVIELENSHASLKERAEIVDEKNPTVEYILEEDNGEDLIVLQVQFGNNGQFDMTLLSTMEGKNDK